MLVKMILVNKQLISKNWEVKLKSLEKISIKKSKPKKRKSMNIKIKLINRKKRSLK